MPAVHSDTPLLKRCRQEVLLFGTASMGHCLGAAGDSLAAAVHNGQTAVARQGAQEALDRLEQRRAAMQAAFPGALDQAIAEAIDMASDPASGRQRGPAPEAPASDTELALLDDSELSHFVETSRLIQIVQPVVAGALARLDTLMSSALEQPVVRPDLNPLRPEVLCPVLMRMLDEQSESAEMRRLWLRHLAKPYARELNDLYRVMSDWLEREGVHQAQYRVKFAEGGIGPVMVMGSAVPGGYPAGGVPAGLAQVSGVFPAGAVGPGNAPADEENLSDEQAIRRRRMPMPSLTEPAGMPAAPAPQTVLGEFHQHPAVAQPRDAALPQDYYVMVQRQLAQLAAAPVPAYDATAWQREQARMQALAVVDRPARAVTPMMPLPPQQWGQQVASPVVRERIALELKAQAGRVGQAQSVDAARALVAQVIADERILAPVREAVLALEPALLRLVLAEPRLAGDSEHPARRLLEALIQRSEHYNDEFSPEFEAFIAPVCQAVQALDATDELAGADFDRTLKALQADWQEQDQADQPARERSLRVMTFAQQRQRLADTIAQDLGRRSDLAGAPSVVADFLFKDWSLVIAQAQLTHGQRQLDPGGYLSIVTDLLWSVKRDKVLHDLTRLFEVVPRVIATLRRGQQALGKDPDEAQALLDMLLRFHEPVLKLHRLRSARGKGVTPEALSQALQLPEAKELFNPNQAPTRQAAAQAWLSRHEREAVGFMGDGIDTPDEFAPTELAAPAAGSAQHEADAETAARAAAQLGRLRQGDWVDLHTPQQWRRAELIWISDNDALYLFASHGGQAHSMTRHTLEKRLRSGDLRPIGGF